MLSRIRAMLPASSRKSSSRCSDVRQVLEHRLHVDHLSQARPIADLLGEDLEQRQVLLDLLARVGALDLHHHRVAGRERRPMHLGDRAGGQRRGLDVIEDVLPRHAELLLHHLHDLFLAERRHVVLQGRELLDVLGREQVGSGRQDLAELGERRTELLERGAQALALPAPAHGALLVGAAEELPQPVLGEDGGDAPAPRGQSGGELDLLGRADPHPGRRRAWHVRHDLPVARRVDDDHRAPRVVADAVGHVPEQELLATGHARVAHDEHVDRLLLRGFDDRHRRVVVDHDVAVTLDRRRPCARTSAGRRRPTWRVSPRRRRTRCRPRSTARSPARCAAPRRTPRRTSPPTARRARPSANGRCRPSRARSGRRSRAGPRRSCAHHGGSRPRRPGWAVRSVRHVGAALRPGCQHPVGRLPDRRRSSSAWQSNRLVSGRSWVQIPSPALCVRHRRPGRRC